jgi:hypothetical protein
MASIPVGPEIGKCEQRLGASDGFPGQKPGLHKLAALRLISTILDASRKEVPYVYRYHL